MMMLLGVFLCLLSSGLTFQSEQKCNIMLDKRGVLYHPTAQSQLNASRSYRQAAEWNTDKDGSAELRDALLAGLTEFPKDGTPGSIVAVDDNIEVIIAAPVKEIVMVAGTFGQGRVIAFSHDAFIWWFTKEDASSDFKVLRDNCYKWVTNGGYDSDWNIVEWGGRENLATADVSNTLALFKVTNSEEDPKDAVDFVRRGGALIVGVTSWAWAERDQLKKMYFQKLAISLGFFFANDYSSSSNTNIADNKAYEAHYGRIMDKILTKADEVTDEEWKFAKDEVEIIGSSSLETIPKLYDAHSEIQKILENDLTFPVKDNKMLYYLVFMTKFYNFGSYTYGKAPGIYVFPFDFETTPAIGNSPEKTLQSRREMYHSTGYYLPAGCQLGVTGSGLEKWKVRVGAADDDLSDKDELKRWPNTMVETTLSDGGGYIYSAYGGSVYLGSPEGEHTITYELEGVVESPQFNGSDPDSIANWKENRDKPGLWTDFFSDKIMLTLPSLSIRNLDDPSDMLDFWTTLCQHFEDLKSAGEIPFIWFAPDVQISAGYMHAGYPLAVQLDVTNPTHIKFLMNKRITDYETNCDASWGPYHEIGHNLQQDAWNFPGTGEVTNNIFSLYGHTKMQGIAPWDSCWLNVVNRKGWRNYLDGGAKFDINNNGMDNYGAQLVIFTQMARDFGYDAYTQVFKLFAAGNQPSKAQEKIDLWVTYMSEVTGKNIAPIFDFWGIPVSKDVWESQASLPVYQPDDLVTQAYPDRMAASVAKAGTYQ